MVSSGVGFHLLAKFVFQSLRGEITLFLGDPLMQPKVRPYDEFRHDRLRNFRLRPQFHASYSSSALDTMNCIQAKSRLGLEIFGGQMPINGLIGPNRSIRRVDSICAT
jgi:hypothetical protein